MKQRNQPIIVAAAMGVMLALGTSCLAQALPPHEADPLKLVISLRQPYVAPPDAVRIVMHLHNSSPQPLWLYRRAKGKRSAQEQDDPVAAKTGGSTVEVRLTLADAAVGPALTPATATVLEYVQMPKPRLAKIEPDQDYEETSIVQFHPAMGEADKPIWGAYKLSVVYSASYPNSEVFMRELEENLWRGEISSNAVDIDLRPPLPDSVGEISGTALGPDLRPRGGVRVSLSDKQGQLIDQRITGGDGKFSFDHLPMALYWITGRRENEPQDTTIFTHQELASSLPRAKVELSFFPSETEDPKRFVHKPVLIRVFDSNQKPAAGVAVDTIYTNGPLIDDLKAVTDVDGTAAMELMPGRIAVSLKMHGCKEQVERADVSPVAGVDGFKYVLDCTKK